VKDGLYQVDYGSIYAGFVITNGVVVQCAPVLRKRLSYWMTMAKPVKQRKQSLIYVHGTNGSGKSTLARYLLMCAGGIRKIAQHPVTEAYCTYSYGRLACVGKYRALTGGADGVQPYALVPKTAIALLQDGCDVLIEGLMSPGVETCQALHDRAVRLGAYVRFIRLDIGFYQSVQNVLRRRMLAGNEKEYDPGNLRKKQRSCDGWLENLGAAGLPIYGLDWNNTRDLCMQNFGLTTEGATRVLEL